MESAAFEQEVRRIEVLIQVLEGLPDPTAREAAKELLQIVLDLHGKGLARILKLVSETGTAGQTLLDAMAKDDQVRGLLLLHGLPPDDAEVRVRQALDSVASHLRAQGIGVVLMGIEQNIVRLKLEGRWLGGTIVLLQRLLEEVIFALAPDMAGVEIDGVSPRPVQEVRVPIPSPPKRAARQRLEPGTDTPVSGTSQSLQPK